MEDAEDSLGSLTVVDVYDIASDIGKECEKIIDQYGAQALTSLMPKVINALENLEYFASKNERENMQLTELVSKISQLENDKIEKAEYRRKFDKDLELIEEQWRAEAKELFELVSKLQEENRRLSKQDFRCTQEPHDGQNDSKMLHRLQTTIEKQRDEIREKDKIIQDNTNDAEVLRVQLDRLTSTSKELRRKHRLFQNQIRSLYDERTDFLIQMQDQQKELVTLKQRLGLAQKENEDLAKSNSPPGDVVVYSADDPNRPRFTTAELKEILHERNELKAKVSELEDELECYRPRNVENSPIDKDAPVQGPLPYEPDDAPWKRSSESGIRKFFRKLFSEGGGGGGSFPRRSLSTLSKLALSSTTEPIPI